MIQHPDHPNLSEHNHHDTSPFDRSYNCVAWAFGESRRWWEPDAMYQYYWPDHLPRNFHLETYIAMFKDAGYEICGSPALQTGVEKIAVFAADGSFKHVARQLESGRWTSKMGSNVDIEHDLLAVEGGRYASLFCIMCRTRQVSSPSAK